MNPLAEKRSYLLNGPWKWSDAIDLLNDPVIYRKRGMVCARNLSVAFDCLFCGLYDQAIELLKLYESIFTASFANGEYDRQKCTDEKLFLIWSYCFSYWALYNKHEGSKRNLVIDLPVEILNDNESMDNNLSRLYELGAYENVVSWYEECRPESLHDASKCKTARSAAYYLSKSTLERGRLSVEEKTAILSKLLNRLIPYYIGNSGCLDAALWLKITYWDEESQQPTAREIIEKFKFHCRWD